MGLSATFFIFLAVFYVCTASLPEVLQQIQRKRVQSVDFNSKGLINLPPHMKILADKLQIINEITSLRTTWKAGLNMRFRYKNKENVKKMMDCVKKDPAKSPKLEIRRMHHLLGDEGIPETFDARQKWPKCTSISEIRDQSNCGSCWAFGAAESMTDRVCIQSNGTEKPHISADDLLSCCDSCGYGCNGGDPSAAWQYWVTDGLVTGGNYTSHSGCKPYPFPPCDHHVNGTMKPCPHDLQPTPQCDRHCQPSYSTKYDKDKHRGSKAYQVENRVNTIQKEIMTNGPVEAAFQVYEDFEHYKSGVYQHVAGEEMGGHAVRILGWGVDPLKDTPYWLVANSWNTDWGEKGYFRIKRGSNECGIEDEITAGKPKLNSVYSLNHV